ncbi:MATE family efflux transporter [Clostridium swellfunianum]|uniref:MATE family efflux transporter n=1 Tax=Clostridium swellfunianum TaxID=1367462 RepID=UPI00202E27B9|nr:MATE family efflux transporter [Clostridium swellfunianum]MCM0650213.1 MATE family efflux transporter [Clostridium swellfunianum]
MNNSKMLGVESCGKLLLKFSVPAVIGMTANALYDFIDRLFLSKAIGILGISAATVVRPMLITVMAFSLLIGVGTSVTISLKLGQNDKSQAEKAIGNAMLLAVAVSLLLILLGLLFKEQLLSLFGAKDEILPLARQFFIISLFGIPFQTLAHILIGACRAEGNPKLSMLTMLSSALLNFILNPAFIFILKLGIAGSALATLCSQGIVSIWLLLYFAGKNSVLRLSFKAVFPDTAILIQILSIGMASFLAQLVSSATMVILNKSLYSYGGNYAVASLGIIQALMMLVLLPVIGINQGMQPILGYNYGAGNYQRVKKTVGLALLSGTYITTIGFIILMLFQTQLFSLFAGKSQELVKAGAFGMRLFLLVLPLSSLQKIEYFEAIGSAKISIFLSLAKQLLFQIPLLFILPYFYKLKGVWLTGAVSDFFSCLLSAVFLIAALYKLKNKSRLPIKKTYVFENEA